ncbi:putative bifunctional diguanylate cyclase/phosphodiesterase [Nocardioides sp.]|uniref:putative bifunctional diguanylate cyclase/phosphodiesterase n=1 Tax=Nocardioides sp. TaxID=35761 RepID=UPI003568F66E
MSGVASAGSEPGSAGHERGETSISCADTAFLIASHATGLSVALVATSLDNASEIAELADPHALELVGQQQQLQVHCMGTQAHLVSTTSAGGLMLAVTARDEIALMDLVAELADRLRTPVEIGDERVWPLVTLGARACFPGESLESVTRQARAALTQARAAGPGTTHWCQPGSEDDAPVRMTLINDLAVAIADTHQLRLHYQPLRDLQTGEIVGAEALLRWKHPGRGPQTASSTVGTAERSGLIGRLGQKVLEMSVRQLGAWKPIVPAGFRLHVNVSPMELSVPGYVDQVEALLREHDVPPQLLLLEITETTAMTGRADTLKSLHRLTDLGVGLGIDDFGTGYSSIAYLRDLPVDTVKVDRSLISGVATSVRDYAMASAVARLLSVMPVRVLAEGVENAEQQKLLRAVGYHYGQGYHLGRPVAGDRFTSTLIRNTSARQELSRPWQHAQHWSA